MHNVIKDVGSVLENVLNSPKPKIRVKLNLPSSSDVITCQVLPGWFSLILSADVGVVDGGITTYVETLLENDQ